METISQKKSYFPDEKHFWWIFLVLPSMADLRKHFIRLHKVLG